MEELVTNIFAIVVIITMTSFAVMMAGLALAVVVGLWRRVK